MSVKGPLRSAGVCQRYSDFDALDTLGYNALTGRNTSEATRFNVVKHGDYISGNVHQMNPEMSNGLSNEFAPQNGRAARPHGPDVPYPQPKKRDDLDYIPRMRPGI
ncbi:MAG: hypothetical protein HYX61_00665 [Gammaproteobacteria bacterium]|jgi:hypothetical protein|nr:hypothetical protein [Gammaproteobacteria bacterium]